MPPASDQSPQDLFNTPPEEMAPSSSTQQNLTQSELNFVWETLESSQNFDPEQPSTSSGNPGHIANGVNNGVPMAPFAASNYINLRNPPPYPGYPHMENGYVNFPSCSSSQPTYLPAPPVMIHLHQRPSPAINNLAMQQNLNNLAMQQNLKFIQPPLPLQPPAPGLPPPPHALSRLVPAQRLPAPAMRPPAPAQRPPAAVQRPPAAGQRPPAAAAAAWNRPINGGGVVKKQKRIRTAFTSQQMMELEHEYARSRYLERTRRMELAEKLRLYDRTIKVWFQNRRMKEKKDRSEGVEEADDVTTTQAVAEVPMFQQPYQPNNALYNNMGVYVEEYPGPSSSVPTAPIAGVPMPQGNYSGYATAQECQPPYQQIQLPAYNLQVPPYPSPNSDVHTSPESTSQSESSISVGTAASNEAAENTWDLSWFKHFQTDEE